MAASKHLGLGAVPCLFCPAVGVWPVLETEGSRYSRMSLLPCQSLPVSTPSGTHLLISVLCCYTNFRCLGVFLVFIFGLISCFSLCASKKISQTEIGNICFALGAALRILLRTFEVKYPLTVNRWTLIFSDICHEGAIAAHCRHSSRCQNIGQDVCSLWFV